MHNLFFVYFVNLYMFRAYLGPSSEGTITFFFKDLLHRKSVRYTGLQNYEIVPLINLP